ncbi:MAG TPA: prolipoprotein diacylglyceryl transferase, partial [Spirochaetota bacterium]|nr:prolipoprotein diacylglyceryl transferase [Spirochaetota bacterium]
FFIYLLLNGVARFAVEFIRLNPKTALLLTQAQLVAICFILIGLVGLFIIRSRASVEKNG